MLVDTMWVGQTVLFYGCNVSTFNTNTDKESIYIKKKKKDQKEMNQLHIKETFQWTKQKISFHSRIVRCALYKFVQTLTYVYK